MSSKSRCELASTSRLADTMRGMSSSLVGMLLSNHSRTDLPPIGTAAYRPVMPRPTRPSTNAHHARLTSPSNTAISVWPLADPLLDWEVLT